MVPFLILSFLSTACTVDDVRKAKQTADRYEARLEQSGALEAGVYDNMAVDAMNAADMAYEAHTARLEGNIAYAIRCECALDRILSGNGF